MQLEITIQPLTIVLCLFPVFFAGMWILVTFILSRIGWADLAENFTYEETFSGTNAGIISARINAVNYQNSLRLQYNTTGLYLRPVIFFRLFHKPLLIPWSEIKYVRDKQILFFSYKELIIGDPYIASIKISERAFSKIETAYRDSIRKNKGYI